MAADVIELMPVYVASEYFLVVIQSLDGSRSVSRCGRRINSRNGSRVEN